VNAQPQERPATLDEIAERVAADIPSGAYVNLGIGLPTKVADFLDTGKGVALHTENGMLNMGREAGPGEIDPDLINAGKIPVVELPGTAYFHHADSFAMIRGGHLDLCVLGAFEVSFRGDLANWHSGEPDSIPAVGGAMDLATGAKRIFVMMRLFGRDGEPKLLPKCRKPLTGTACVDRVYSDWADFDLSGGQPEIVRTFGASSDEIAGRLGLGE
jgi:3-oxoadipate CoA-transferase beta subunit